LRRTGDIVVGDNEPYSGRHPADFTIDHHAEPLGLAHIGIEIRQDLINDVSGQQRWGSLLAEALESVLSNEALYRSLRV
jgi:predicted N-formylglutamate amidohydrolase